jgi:hypothetical protein
MEGCQLTEHCQIVQHTFSDHVTVFDIDDSYLMEITVAIDNLHCSTQTNIRRGRDRWTNNICYFIRQSLFFIARYKYLSFGQFLPVSFVVVTLHSFFSMSTILNQVAILYLELELESDNLVVLLFHFHIWILLRLAFDNSYAEFIVLMGMVSRRIFNLITSCLISWNMRTFDINLEQVRRYIM